MNIGVFDSGIGGLTILKAFLHNLPNYTYIYYGDNANAPYGEKSSDEIYDLTIKGIEFLISRNCSLIILACNTASTVLPKIQQEWLPNHYPDKKILGIIRPTVETMIKSGHKEINLLATPATVSAKSYEKEMQKIGSSQRINSVACPGLAKAIENSQGEVSQEIRRLLEKPLKLIDQNKDVPVYLGCTHYEFVEEFISKQIRTSVSNQSSFCASSLHKYIARHREKLNLISSKSVTIHASKNEEEFKSFAHKMLLL